MITPAWQKFEHDVQNLLGLSSTIASGNQAHDPGDGVNRSHPYDINYAVMVDAKHTTNKSFSLSRKTLDGYLRRAQTFGKRFALPLRFEDLRPNRNGVKTRSDWVVVPLDDYAELVEKVNNVQD